MMIRAAVESDAEAIASLSGQLGYPATATEIRSRLEGIRDRGDGKVFVADAGGSIVAWVHVFGALVLESPAHAEIGGLVVDERHRGRGIGAELMGAAERWAVLGGYSSVRLRSNVVREAAHGFCSSLGYAETKRQVVFVKPLAPGGRSEGGAEGA